jgi:transposase InsO family protein
MVSACIGIGQWFLFYNESRPHQALGHKISTATWAAEVSPADLPLRLDDAARRSRSHSQQPQILVYI